MISKNYFKIITLILILGVGFLYWHAFSLTGGIAGVSGGDVDPEDCGGFLGKAAAIYHSDGDQDKKSAWLDSHVWNRTFTWKMRVAEIVQGKVGGRVLGLECGDQTQFTIDMALTGEDRNNLLPFKVGNEYTFTSKVVMIHNLVSGPKGMDMSGLPSVSFDLEYISLKLAP
jgi:hypothetical protein